MASEQFGKFYGDDLRPVYEVPSADGKKMVKVTLVQAKKLGLLYSVSRILEEAASFELIEWGKDQVARAAVEYPFDFPDKSEESLAAYASLLKAKADEFRTSTADRGKEMHAAVERHFRGEAVDRTDPAIDRVLYEFEAKFGEWGAVSFQPERAIGGRKFGVVGTPDLPVECEDGILRIVDYKTTDLSKFKLPYTKWKLQLGAYHWLTGDLPQTEIWQAVGDRTTGEVRFFRHEDADRWKNAFIHLYEYTVLITGYDPRTIKAENS